MNNMLSKVIKTSSQIFVIISLAIIVVGVTPIAMAYSTTISVNTTDDELNTDGDCSLREAIEAANTDSVVDTCSAGSDNDTIEVPAGTYTLTIVGQGDDENETGDLDISDGTLTILGSGAENTVISGNGIDRVIHIVGQEAVLTIQEITIADGNCPDTCGYYGGGIYNKNGGSLTVKDSIISGNTAHDGGGIYNDNYDGGSLTVTDSIISGNTTSNEGGGVYFYGGTLTLSNTIITSNSAFSGGGGIEIGEAVATITSSSINDNSAGNYGGGITIRGRSTLIVRESSISGNYAALGGGIHLWENVQVQDGSSLSFANSTIDFIGNNYMGHNFKGFFL